MTKCPLRPEDRQCGRDPAACHALLLGAAGKCFDRSSPRGRNATCEELARDGTLVARANWDDQGHHPWVRGSPHNETVNRGG